MLNPQVQYDDSDKQSGAGRDAVIRTDNEILSPHDLRRLEKYSSSLVDHHVITDLVPPITRAYFAKRIPVTLSYAQAAILLGMGLQQRTLDDSSKQLDLPPQQVMALFNKAMRRIYGALKLGRVKEIEAALPSYVMPNLKPHAIGVDEDLQEGYVSFVFILFRVSHFASKFQNGGDGLNLRDLSEAYAWRRHHVFGVISRRVTVWLNIKLNRSDPFDFVFLCFLSSRLLRHRESTN